MKSFVPSFFLLRETLCQRFVALADRSSAATRLVCADNVSIWIFRSSDKIESVAEEVMMLVQDINLTREARQRIWWRFHQPKFYVASFLRTPRWDIFMSFTNNLSDKTSRRAWYLSLLILMRIYDAKLSCSIAWNQSTPCQSSLAAFHTLLPRCCDFLLADSSRVTLKMSTYGARTKNVHIFGEICAHFQTLSRISGILVVFRA